ncbi:hypothetical protein DSM25559_0383 [Agrobacterium rosae]|uniref:Uncharacterized protein n=1 Tax=Agrobacterium rosae TaxID=1972867 RepID=A0A1R3TCT6_9HYPH|nr:hypothetical protein DSM25559_0383 [Agrobacterium rosae]
MPFQCCLDFHSRDKVLAVVLPFDDTDGMHMNLRFLGELLLAPAKEAAPSTDLVRGTDELHKERGTS